MPAGALPGTSACEEGSSSLPAAGIAPAGCGAVVVASCTAAADAGGAAGVTLAGSSFVVLVVGCCVVAVCVFTFRGGSLLLLLLSAAGPLITCTSGSSDGCGADGAGSSAGASNTMIGCTSASVAVLLAADGVAAGFVAGSAMRILGSSGDAAVLPAAGAAGTAAGVAGSTGAACNHNIRRHTAQCKPQKIAAPTLHACAPRGPCCACCTLTF